MVRTLDLYLVIISICHSYFHAGFALELLWTLKKSPSTIGCHDIGEHLKVNKLFYYCAVGFLFLMLDHEFLYNRHVAGLEFITQCVCNYKHYDVTLTCTDQFVPSSSSFQYKNP